FCRKGIVSSAQAFCPSVEVLRRFEFTIPSIYFRDRYRDHRQPRAMNAHLDGDETGTMAIQLYRDRWPSRGDHGSLAGHRHLRFAVAFHQNSLRQQSINNSTDSGLADT